MKAERAKKTEAEPVAPARAPAPIGELTPQWARAKVMEETGKREASALRAEIAKTPEAKDGYSDDHLVIAETSEVDLEDKDLLRVLRAEKCLKRVLVPEISLKKLRAAAELNPKIAAAVAAATSTKLRFDRATRRKESSS